MSRKRLKIQTRMFTTRTEMGTQIRKIIRKKSYQVLVVEREAHVCPGTELISDDESSAAGVGLRCLRDLENACTSAAPPGGLGVACTWAVTEGMGAPEAGSRGPHPKGTQTWEGGREATEGDSL